MKFAPPQWSEFFLWNDISERYIYEVWLIRNFKHSPVFFCVCVCERLWHKKDGVPSFPPIIDPGDVFPSPYWISNYVTFRESESHFWERRKRRSISEYKYYRRVCYREGLSLGNRRKVMVVFHICYGDQKMGTRYVLVLFLFYRILFIYTRRKFFWNVYVHRMLVLIPTAAFNLIVLNEIVNSDWNLTLQLGLSTVVKF